MPLLERKNPQGVPKKSGKGKKKIKHIESLYLYLHPLLLMPLYWVICTLIPISIEMWFKKKNTIQFILFRRVLIRGSIAMWILQMRELWFRVTCLRSGSQYSGFKNQYVLNIYIHSYVHTNLRTGTGLSSFYSVK